MAEHKDRLRAALVFRNIRPSVVSYKTGIPEAAISHYLKGDYEPKHKRMKLLADALRVSEAWLSGFDVPMTEETSFSELDRTDSNTENSVKIPVLGYVAAGIPIEAITDILDYEEIDPSMIKDGSEYFALKIKGDSMEPKISNGDVVIVRKQEDCDSGQIAIVCVNGDQATCKKILKQSTGIMLVPFNPAYETVFYSNEDILEIPITILGRVVELRAKF